MEQKNNCAGRVKWILTNALHQDGKKPIKEIWSEVLFDVEEYSPDDFEIIRLIESLSSETKLIGVKARKLGLPENLYKPYVEKTLKALNVTNINSAWDNYKKFITSDSRLLCILYIPNR